MKSAKRVIMIGIVTVLCILSFGGCGILNLPNRQTSAEENKKRDVIGIEISELPEKVIYDLRESLEVRGGKVSVKYSDGKSETVGLSETEVTGFSSETEGIKELTVCYGGKTASFSVEVADFSACVLRLKENGGYFEETPEKRYTPGREFLLPTPKKLFCSFLGWYPDKDFTGNPVVEIPAGARGIQTYYAKWENLSGNNKLIVTAENVTDPLKDTYTAGDTVLVKVSVAGNVCVAGIEAGLFFDNTAFSIQESSISCAGGYEICANSVNFSWVNQGGGNRTDVLELLQVKFTVSDVTEGSYVFDLKNPEITAVVGETVTSTAYELKTVDVLVEEAEK